MYLDLQNNQIGDVGASGIGAGLAYAQYCHPIFFDFRFLYIFFCILGQYSMKFYVFYIACSTNKTLQVLWLQENRIGDVGASGIVAGLAYVQSCHPKFSIFDFYTFCFDIGAIYACVCIWFVWFAAPTQH